MKSVKFLLLIAAVLCLVQPASRAGGLATTTGSMYLGNLKIGQTYSLKQLVGYGFNAQYRGVALVVVNISARRPRNTTSDGFEPIPDETWVDIDRRSFALDSYQTAETDIHVTIPNDEKYLGKKYCVLIVPETSAATVVGGGIALGTALECALRLDIAPKPATPEEIRLLKKQLLGQALQVNISPERVFLTEVPIGRNVDVKQEYGDDIKIVNMSDFECNVEIEQLPASKLGFFPPVGYKEPEKQEWLKLGKKKFKVGANQIGIIPLYVNLPKDKVKKNDKLLFTMRVLLSSKIRQVMYTPKVYIDVETEPIPE